MGKNGERYFDHNPQAINVTVYSVQLSLTPSELMCLLRKYIPMIAEGVRKRDILEGNLTDEQYKTRWTVSDIGFNPTIKYAFALAQLRGIMAVPPDMVPLGVRRIVSYDDIRKLLKGCRLVLRMLEKIELEATFPIKLSRGAQKRFDSALHAGRTHSRMLFDKKTSRTAVGMRSGRGR